MTQRRCRYRAATRSGAIGLSGFAKCDPYASDLVHRLFGLLAIITRPAEHCQDPVRRDDELLDRL